jgi:hypothetical protein
MTLREFAEKHNLRLKRDNDDTSVVEGRTGQLYEYSGSELGVLILPPTYTPRLYSAIKKKCLSSGMSLLQDGDAEGTFSFDPTDKEQATMAIKVAQVRPKKQISEAHKRKLLNGLQTRKNSGAGPILQGCSRC